MSGILKSDIVVCAFYTKKYEHLGKQLLEDCNKLEQECYVGEPDSLKKHMSIAPQAEWRWANKYKPTFIKEMLNTYKKPVVYVDADTILMKKLDIQLKCDVGINHQRERLYSEMEKVKVLDMHANCVFFNYNARAMEFLDTWEYKCLNFLWHLCDHRMLKTTIHDHKGHVNIKYMDNSQVIISDKFNKNAYFAHNGRGGRRDTKTKRSYQLFNSIISDGGYKNMLLIDDINLDHVYYFLRNNLNLNIYGSGKLFYRNKNINLDYFKNVIEFKRFFVVDKDVLDRKYDFVLINKNIGEKLFNCLCDSVNGKLFVFNSKFGKPDKKIKQYSVYEKPMGCIIQPSETEQL